ncbi:MAG: hypothetical protein FJX02_15385 [Alphaproteobacteria bacterium]|nr:hypothetical protein [Alphaproteobacteria bacterium]
MGALVRTILALVLVTALTACEQLGIRPAPTAPPVAAAPSPAPPDPRLVEIDNRKDELLRKLAVCESGGSGISDKAIYGGRGRIYNGRFQFTLRTLIAYVRQRDGVELNLKEAHDFAQDYERAAALTKYMIFDLAEPWHWPLCRRKIAMDRDLREIRLLEDRLAGRA